METWEKVALGVAALAALGAIVIASSAKAAAPGPALPAGKYTLMPPGTVLQPGKTYLLSASPQSDVNAQTFAQAIQELQTAGFKVLGAWNVGQTPSGWPTGDPNATTGVHVAVTNASTTAQTTGSDVTTWIVQ
jgi:hypothetical protein